LDHAAVRKSGGRTAYGVITPRCVENLLPVRSFLLPFWVTLLGFKLATKEREEDRDCDQRLGRWPTSGSAVGSRKSFLCNMLDNESLGCLPNARASVVSRQSNAREGPRPAYEPKTRRFDASRSPCKRGGGYPHPFPGRALIVVRPYVLTEAFSHMESVPVFDGHGPRPKGHRAAVTFQY
jgi:hypothetical protein